MTTAWAILVCVIVAVGTFLAFRAHFSPKLHSSPPRIFMINEAGNVMIVGTAPPGGRLPSEALARFGNALAKMACIMKATQTTNNPAESRAFSIFDYHAMNRIFSACPFLSLESRQDNLPLRLRPANLEKEWARLLYGQEMPPCYSRKARAMFNSMQKEAGRMPPRKHDSAELRVAQFVLTCEHADDNISVLLTLMHFAAEHVCAIGEKAEHSGSGRNRMTLSYGIEKYRFEAHPAAQLSP